LGPTLSKCATSNPMSKFDGDRPRDLGDMALQSARKTSAVKHKTAGNYSSGLPNNHLLL